MKMIEVQVVALTNSETHEGQFTLVLESAALRKRIPITIGPVEAQAIAMAVESIQPPRPLTHDLFYHAMQAIDVTLMEVIIREIIAERYHASITLVKEGKTYTIDARTSDAVALALRFDCPIYTYDTLLESAGYGIEAQIDPADKEGYIHFPVDELEKMMEQAIKAEDYESASRIRDVINQKRGI